MENCGGCFGRDWVCSSLGQVSKRVGRADAVVPLECLLAGVMVELSRGEWLALFVKCVRELARADGCFSLIGMY